MLRSRLCCYGRRFRNDSSRLIASLVEYRIKGKTNVDIVGITFDSRKVNPGQLFVCLPITIQDSHLFVHDVFVTEL